MIDVLFIVFAPIAGFLTKLADDYSEIKQRKRLNEVVYGILYSLAIIAAGLFAPELISLIAGISIGNTFAGKIDRLGHIIALTVIMAFAAYNVNLLDFVFVVGFALTAFIDEIMHEYERNLRGMWRIIADKRIISPIFALALLPITWTYFAYILLFDIGYHFCTLFWSKSKNL